MTNVCEKMYINLGPFFLCPELKEVPMETDAEKMLNPYLGNWPLGAFIWMLFLSPFIP